MKIEYGYILQLSVRETITKGMFLINFNVLWSDIARVTMLQEQRFECLFKRITISMRICISRRVNGTKYHMSCINTQIAEIVTNPCLPMRSRPIFLCSRLFGMFLLSIIAGTRSASMILTLLECNFCAVRNAVGRSLKIYT